MIVTFDDFRDHLGLTANPPNTPDLMMKLEQATQLVLDYIRRSDDADQVALIEDWESETATAPLNVRAAILLWATELARFRGDDLDDVKRDAPGDPSPTVKALLARNGRRPVFA